ncbi:MAG: hypothetical protein M3136_02060 [Thermoproteota archaeon]|nr:hypothetical protein [Thermoproteota archaeon]MDQ4017062.1 hypothetical protein [Thermoproteota archaeon]
MSEYAELAAKRYRQYISQKQKQSLIHRLVTLVLRILHALVGALQQARIKKARRVEKISVEREES